MYVFLLVFLLVNATLRRKTEMQFKILSKRHCQEVAFASTKFTHVSSFCKLFVIGEDKYLRIILVTEGRRCSTSVARASLNIIVLVSREFK